MTKPAEGAIEKASPAVEDARIVAATSKIRGMMAATERFECAAVQRRIYALFSRRLIVAATSQRLFAMKRHVLPGFSSTEVHWPDLAEASLAEGVFGSTLVILTTRGETLTFKGLRKMEAQALYRVCQTREQEWREKHRTRALEEARAKAGGVVMNAGTPGTPPASDPTEQLARAKSMLDQGLISDVEYEEVKARVLSRL
jgi:hypothetical protein